MLCIVVGFIARFVATIVVCFCCEITPVRRHRRDPDSRPTGVRVRFVATIVVGFCVGIVGHEKAGALGAPAFMIRGNRYAFLVAVFFEVFEEGFVGHFVGGGFGGFGVFVLGCFGQKVGKLFLYLAGAGDVQEVYIGHVGCYFLEEALG